MNYKYPMKDKQDAIINQVEGVDDNGKPNIVATETVKCTFIEQHRMKPDKNGGYLQTSGLLFKKGDIMQQYDKISGYVTVGTIKYEIYASNRVKDPCGNVHHIELELM